MLTLTYLIILAFIVSCTGYAAFEQFPGFDGTVPAITSTSTSVTTDNLKQTLYTEYNDSTQVKMKPLTEVLEKTETTTPPTQNTSVTKKERFECPEEEMPKNIGPYEVPTQRDLAMLTKNILLKSYDSYSQQSMQLLKDIKEATRAALTMESKCRFNKQIYAQCIKSARKQCEQYMKDSMINLEAQRLDVLALTEDKICNLSDMKADPLQLVKLLAKEQSTLDFALPGFLLLINSCNSHCVRSYTSPKNKPVRHMTDQDLVIRHFLTKKNYNELIFDSKRKV